jgi:hypothetical protein
MSLINVSCYFLIENSPQCNSILEVPPGTLESSKKRQPGSGVRDLYGSQKGTLTGGFHSYHFSIFYPISQFAK